MEIRLAKISERRVLEALQWRAALNNPGDRQALLANPDAIEIPISQIEQGFVFVAEEEGHINGFAGILERPDGNIELDALFVEPVSWKKGIGRALVDYCASFALAKGANYLHVVGNPHAEGFYLACGFRVIGTEKTRFGSGLLMKKALPASTK
ncbi:MAG: GNAT family N-acetyltransferase [Anaerolineae bacterium]|nr:GNAT family N-acetyltransferase [Anaerolineae bacterium]